MPTAFDSLGPVYGDPITLALSAARTTSGNAGAVPSGPYGTLRLTLDITAVSGTTPSMTVTIETSPDGTTNWTTIGTPFAAQTGVANIRKVVTGADRFVRASYTITGTTPSFTFSVTGVALGGAW